MPLDLTDNKIVTFTDCVEVSLLSLLRMFFVDLSNPDQLDLILARKHVTDPNLNTFLEEHCSRIMSDAFYRETEEGRRIRTDWTVFLSRREGFRYNKGKFEFTACDHNMVHFFRTFCKDVPLPEVADSIEKVEKSVISIFEYFSRPEYQFEVKFQHEKYGSEDSLYVETLVKIYVNKMFLFTWRTWESFKYDERQRGHTQIYKGDI